ncbi:uncharacterized protein LOC112504295 [Cynara cardunculus var. scolymus]|uniref:Uncharacterized protein n=1 Tax=Cynara cardunculus var. scolymus TaxID=59895 RepID=A0A103TVK1_CYNCS|nr:uncharacterized protein LOC112504295 [Cynara cardunculus var. scolymus]KVH24188.1 hypothetical protein Ccrd_025874 [Cynara cardunculus var. scolymus]
MLPEKPVHASWVFRSTIHWSFRVLVLAVVLGLMIFWAIDSLDVSDFHKDFLVKFDVNLVKGLKNFSTTNGSDVSINFNLTNQENQDFAGIQEVSPIKPLNDTTDLVNVTGKPPAPVILKWVSAELDPDYSSNLLARWLTPGGEPCKDSSTEDIFIQGLDNLDHQIDLWAGDRHEYVIQALDNSGRPRCLGGDYFETDLSGDAWKSRPPIKDFGDGRYSFSLQVHPDFVGDYNLTIILLFRHYQGLKFSPERFAFDKVLRVFPITFKNSNSSHRLPEIRRCKKSDYTRDAWAGRWTRHGKNDECMISKDGRYRCLQRDYPCKHPWCDGSLGSVESNGWVYSTHCSFKLFDAKAAWRCLNNRWLFFWGDSNHCDTIRNMLNFVLNVEIATVPRLFDMNITNPKNPGQSVRITSVFNGHYNHTGNYQGLNSLYNDAYRDYLKKYFSGEIVPDTLIMNSGLHDGVYWPNLRKFTKGAQDAAAFWAEVLGGVRRRKVVVPEVIYRTTVATGGYARRLVFNPNKMEAFNGVLLDKLRQFGVIDHVVDHFDMTYPWHFDNRCNDGVHYGRAPAKMRWRDGQIGHQYFVDLMLCHVLLNVLCAR